MEKDDFLKDDFLRELIQETPRETPSDGFVDRIMANIQMSPETAVAKKTFYVHLQTIAPYVVTGLVVVFVIFTSDLPMLNWFPGKNYLTNNLLPYLGTLLMVFKSAFASKFVSWVFLISFSAGVLVVIDRLFSRRNFI